MASNSVLRRLVLAGLLAASSSVHAHSWIEQMTVIAPNGTFVGDPGYARGNVLRSSPDFSDPTMVNLIPPDGRTINEILPTDLMCKSTQTSQTQTDGSPRLQAAPGAGIALRYQENGHVTLPANQPGKPTNRGTVYVYGTTQPSPDDAFLAIHRVWTPDGTGGDGRGVLLSTQNFDDGQCYQVNGGAISQQRQQEFPHVANTLMGADIWCQQDIALPANAPTGQPYALYWVWDWPTLPGTAGFPDGKQEIYTTCMDVDVVGSGSTGTVSNAEGSSFVQGQSLDSAAIESEVADITNPTAVTGSTIAFSASATGPASGAAAAASASFVATESDTTSIPGYLSVHTTSTDGPGLETATTIIPIGVTPTTVTATTTAPQPGSQSGHKPGGFGSSGDPTAAPNAGETGLIFSVLPITSTLTNSAPTQPMVTFTQFDPFTETVYNTIVHTLYTKRDNSTFLSSPLVHIRITSIHHPFSSSSAACSPTGSENSARRCPDPFCAVSPPQASSPSSSGGDVLTVDLVDPTETSSAISCSQTESAYRLKARNPFFLLFGGQAEATMGC